MRNTQKILNLKNQCYFTKKTKNIFRNSIKKKNVPTNPKIQRDKHFSTPKNNFEIDHITVT